MKIKLRLILDIVYEANGTPVKELKEMMRDIAHNAAGEGLMTGGTEAEVTTWKAEVLEQ